MSNPTTARRPRPGLTQDNRPFFDAASEGRLVIQRCRSCETLQHPPAPRCATCGSYDLGWVDASGKGTVYAYTVAHHPQVDGFDYPLVIAVVELAEGTRLVSNIVDCDPRSVSIGMPVTVRFVAVDPELRLPLFVPSEGSAPSASVTDRGGH